MIYLIRSYGPQGKSILKVGFSDNLETRLSSYFYSNPFSEVLKTKEGDEVYESLLHEYLGFLGYRFKMDGKLYEWYEDLPEVIRIFNLPYDDLLDLIWKVRGEIFDPKKLKIFSKSDYTYKLLSSLYERQPGEYHKEKFVINEDGGITENMDCLEIDEVYWKIYNNLNPPKIDLSDIYSEESLKVVTEFLDSKFYNTGIFHEKMRMYCEFVDQYKDNLEIMDILNHKITNPRFSQFYEYFGTSGCRARNYRECYLLEAWGNDSKEEKLMKEIYLTFKEGDRYPMKELKYLISKIYRKLGITKTPKATDLGKYFTLTKTSITTKDKKIVSGFKLGKL